MLFTKSVRISHWLIVFLFISLVFTSLMNEFWYSKASIISSIDFSYPMLGLEELMPDEKLFIARMERRFGWGTHFYLGISFVTVFSFLFIYSLYHKRKRNVLTRNYFFSLSIIMFLTGLILYLRSFMTTEFENLNLSLTYKNNEWIISEGLIDLSRSIHHFTAYLFVLSVLFHISRIIYLENTKENGIVSKMINGGKNK